MAENDLSYQRRQELRASWIQAASFGVGLGAAVLFSLLFINRIGAAAAAGLGLATALVTGGLMLWVFLVRPPQVDTASEEDLTAESSDTPSGGTGGDDDESGWTVGTFLLAAIAVPLFVVAAIAVRFIVPLAIIMAFWFAGGSGSLLPALVAAGCCLALMAAVEFGVELPLRRRWHLPMDDQVRPREDFCPTPTRPGEPDVAPRTDL